MVYVFPALLLCGIFCYFFMYHRLIADEKCSLRSDREERWRRFVAGVRAGGEASPSACACAEDIHAEDVSVRPPDDEAGLMAPAVEDAAGESAAAESASGGRSEAPKAGFTLPERFLFPKAFPLEKKDALPVIIITAIYAVVAFLNLGIFTNPQTFWRAEGENSLVTIDIGKNTDISRLMYYTGIWIGEYTFETSEDGVTYTRRSNLKQPHSDIFKWLYSEDRDMENVRYLRIGAEKGPLELGEIALLTGSEGSEEKIDASDFKADIASASNLFDEQDTVPDRPDFLNSAYFDEIYHARTAYEHKIGVYPYETTHPPLGKLIIMMGINLFGLVPFGWRFMGTLFGVLMLPIMFCFLKNIFGKTSVAACGTVIFASDFMHFTQTRIATIDTYSVFFIILMYFFMYRYIAKGPEASFREGAADLFLCGLSFGVGAACKWTSVYAGAGLFILLCLSVYIRANHTVETFKLDRGVARDFSGFLIKTFVLCALAFIIVPGIIYVLSYLPYAQSSGRPLLEIALENQKGMFSYHSGVVDTHPYESRWYQWIFDIRPILYYADSYRGMYSSFGAFGNPLLYWAGLAAMAFMGVWSRVRRDGKALFILIAYLSQLIPWVLVPRLTFAYHYFPSSVFLILALCFVQAQISRRESEKKWLHYAPATVSVLLFIWFYPALSGLPTSSFFVRNFINWLPSWPFFG